MGTANSWIGVAEVGNRPQVKALALRVVQERFSHVHPVWVERHLALLVALRSRFGADLDKAIILGLIGQRMMRVTPAPSVDYDAVLAGDVQCLRGRFTNIESIAASSGIPRETVRRKVGELEAIGWIRRGARGEIELTDLPAQSLDDTTRIAMDLLASVFEVINHELHRPDAGGF